MGSKIVEKEIRSVTINLLIPVPENFSTDKDNFFICFLWITRPPKSVFRKTQGKTDHAVRGLIIRIM